MARSARTLATSRPTGGAPTHRPGAAVQQHLGAAVGVPGLVPHRLQGPEHGLRPGRDACRTAPGRQAAACWSGTSPEAWLQQRSCRAARRHGAVGLSRLSRLGGWARLQAHAVRAVRVGKVARRVDLMWPAAGGAQAGEQARTSHSEIKQLPGSHPRRGRLQLSDASSGAAASRRAGRPATPASHTGAQRRGRLPHAARLRRPESWAQASSAPRPSRLRRPESCAQASSAPHPPRLTRSESWAQARSAPHPPRLRRPKSWATMRTSSSPSGAFTTWPAGRQRQQRQRTAAAAAAAAGCTSRRLAAGRRARTCAHRIACQRP